MTTQPDLTLASLNEMDAVAFVDALGQVVEHSPWVAETIAQRRPFRSLDALHAAMIGCIRASAPDKQDKLFRQHPELAGAEAIAGQMTASSTSEQGRLGLTSLSPLEFARLAELNRAYRERFGFPCIIALRLHEARETVFDTFEKRIAGDVDEERSANIDQIAQIVRGRLYLLVPPTGWLSTHVLDTSSGLPAPGMRIDLFEQTATGARFLKTILTNADGRTDQRLLTGGTMLAGRYRLDFHVADYYRRQGQTTEGLSFLDVVPIAFGMSDPNLHYHVPLLCTPWSYSTYRGS